MRGSSLHNGARPANSMDQDSFDSLDDSDQQQLLIHATHGLNLSGGEDDSSREDNLNLTVNDDNNELPKSIIVTSVALMVFDNEGIKANFEQMFREFDPSCLFHYLRSFRRVRVDFETHLTAANAKLNLDGTPIGEDIIHCYFIQLLSPSEDGGYLHVPPVTRQYLISPPASPPVGWEQPKEDKPVVDYDLLAAMAQLLPGENHELHPAKQVTMLGKSISTPSIVVQVCEATGEMPNPAIRSVRGTRCPERQSSLD